MGLVEMVQAREAVDKVCAAIDAGELQPSEHAMLALATLVSKTGGPLAHELLVKLASRSSNGSKAMRDRALP